MNNSPFNVTSATPKALVRFWLDRPTAKAIGKRAFKSYIETLFEPTKAKVVLKNGYFLVDDAAKAQECVAILERVRDSSVSQFVFGAKAYAAI